MKPYLTNIKAPELLKSTTGVNKNSNKRGSLLLSVTSESHPGNVDVLIQ